MPDYSLTRFDPAVVLFLVLPPLLYAGGVGELYIGFRKNARAIGLLSVGLVLATTVIVGFVFHAALGLSLAAAFMLGALVAPPDAVAATAIGRSLGLPRQMLVVLGGESLLNDATALTAYRVALAAAWYGRVAWQGVTGFVIAAVGGLVVGLVAAPILQWIRLRVADPVLDNVLALLIPFGVYAIAESIHIAGFAASGVLAVVVVGLYLGHRKAQTTYSSRLIAGGVWKTVKFFLESIVFALIGLQLPPIVIRGRLGLSPFELIASGVGIVLLVIVIRMAWVYPATYVPRFLFKKIRERDPYPSWRQVTVVAWSGMRGVVSLAAAFAIPENVPGRGLILYLVFCVVLGTLVAQGLTLPTVIRKLGVSANDTFADNLAEANAQQAAIRAAVERLETLLSEEEVEPPDGVADRLRAWAESRQLGAWERLGSGPGPGAKETPSAAYRRLRREMLTAERAVFVRMRDGREIDDEVLRRVTHELDLEEAMLARE